jgi:hypothetical protein
MGALIARLGRHCLFFPWHWGFQVRLLLVFISNSLRDRSSPNLRPTGLRHDCLDYPSRRPRLLLDQNQGRNSHKGRTCGKSLFLPLSRSQLTLTPSFPTPAVSRLWHPLPRLHSVRHRAVDPSRGHGGLSSRKSEGTSSDELAAHVRLASRSLWRWARLTFGLLQRSRHHPPHRWIRAD